MNELETALMPSFKPSTWMAARRTLPVVLIEGPIDDQEQAQVQMLVRKMGKPDFLIVVDFGYKLPSWLLSLANLHPINVHPSDLPRWRGSSPGQFVLLNGEKESAIAIITMSSKFDQGKIVAKIPLKVGDDWTQTEYYYQAFTQISVELPDLLKKLAEKEIVPKAQPVESPTPVARRLKKDDAFVEWQEVRAAMGGKDLEKAQYIERASRAFQPWPILWTTVGTSRGQKRMKILKTKIESGENGQSNNKLKLIKIQIEGGQPALWNQVKNQILE